MCLRAKWQSRVLCKDETRGSNPRRYTPRTWPSSRRQWGQIPSRETGIGGANPSVCMQRWRNWTNAVALEATSPEGASCRFESCPLHSAAANRLWCVRGARTKFSASLSQRTSGSLTKTKARKSLGGPTGRGTSTQKTGEMPVSPYAVAGYQRTHSPATREAERRLRGANPCDGATGGGSAGDSHWVLSPDSAGSIPVTRI